LWKRNAGFKCNKRFIAKVSTDTLGGQPAPGAIVSARRHARAPTRAPPETAGSGLPWHRPDPRPRPVPHTPSRKQPDTLGRVWSPLAAPKPFEVDDGRREQAAAGPRLSPSRAATAGESRLPPAHA